MKAQLVKESNIRVVQDEYDENKEWLIKRYKCGHYYINQTNSGRKLNKGFQRMNKKTIEAILMKDL